MPPLLRWILPVCMFVGGCDGSGLAENVESSTAAAPFPTETPAPKTHPGRGPFAAPIVDGFSDPNRIVYDDDYLRAYQNRQFFIRCGAGYYEIVTSKYSLTISSGLNESMLGQRFRLEDLLRFLETRRNNPNFEQVFPLRDPELLSKLRENDHGTPWTAHLGIALSLVGGTAYKPAIPLLKDLAANDPDPWIRAGATRALGAFTRAHPEALEALKQIAADPNRRETAEVGLKMAEEVRASTVYVKPLEEPEAEYRHIPARELE